MNLEEQVSLCEGYLSHSCELGNIDLAKYTVEKYGEYLTGPLENSGNILQILATASRNGHLELVKYFVEECALSSVLVTHQTLHGALSQAVHGEHLSVVKYLVPKFCDPSSLSDSSFTPSKDIFLYLLSTGKYHPKEHILKTYSGLPFSKVLSQIKSCKLELPVDAFVKVFLLGNPSAGKSTLAANFTSQCKSFQLWKFGKVGGVKLCTAGIVPMETKSKKLGNLVLYDLAGQPKYYQVIFQLCTVYCKNLLPCSYASLMSARKKMKFSKSCTFG